MTSAKGLQGKTVVMTRPLQQGEEMKGLIEQKGGKVLIAPMIRQQFVPDLSLLDAAWAHIDDYDALLFTSVNGVRFFWNHIREKERTAEAARARICGKTLIAVGPRTAQALEERELSVDMIPDRYLQEDLLCVILRCLEPEKRILFPRAKVIRDHLLKHLRFHRYQVDDIIVYETVEDSSAKPDLLLQLKQGQVHVLTFTSPSTAVAFNRWLARYVPRKSEQEALLQGLHIACIGPVTAKEVHRLGLPVHIEAECHTAAGMVKAMCQFYGG